MVAWNLRVSIHKSARRYRFESGILTETSEVNRAVHSIAHLSTGAARSPLASSLDSRTYSYRLPSPPLPSPPLPSPLSVFICVHPRPFLLRVHRDSVANLPNFSVEIGPSSLVKSLRYFNPHQRTQSAIGSADATAERYTHARTVNEPHRDLRPQLFFGIAIRKCYSQQWRDLTQRRGRIFGHFQRPNSE